MTRTHLLGAAMFVALGIGLLALGTYLIATGGATVVQIVASYVGACVWLIMGAGNVIILWRWRERDHRAAARHNDSSKRSHADD
jgi:membrane protein implicated in regulation of membrane protease activity